MKSLRALPNLTRIPADGDVRAAQILQRLTGPVTGELLESPGDRDVLALGKYGALRPRGLVFGYERAHRRGHDHALVFEGLNRLLDRRYR